MRHAIKLALAATIAAGTALPAFADDVTIINRDPDPESTGSVVVRERSDPAVVIKQRRDPKIIIKERDTTPDVTIRGSVSVD